MIEHIAIPVYISGGLAAVAAIAGALGLGLVAISSNRRNIFYREPNSNYHRGGGKPKKPVAYRSGRGEGGKYAKKAKEAGGDDGYLLRGVKNWFGNNDPQKEVNAEPDYNDSYNDVEYDNYYANTDQQTVTEAPVQFVYYMTKDGTRRKKRSIQNDKESQEEMEAAEKWRQAKIKEERMMEVVRAQDSSGCGLKLVCELASLNNEQLTYDHLAMLDLVGPESSSEDEDFY
ncbi:uncharacterized protein LOC108666141 isoform X2 [Hyalella azteca]|uniref:Uncharacterized protein LOC108666141 isoform X2 n=1 Tax=Hyalella azteca TaxID=294128 RepID=A0A8B7N549_HYAAZ|nr:uncharacterized protein LOC108666141 isoform X2 [Hyalella azteca]